MKATIKEKTKELYRNTKEIILFFEDQMSANLTWYRNGNLMYLNRADKDVCVFYDRSIFRKI